MSEAPNRAPNVTWLLRHPKVRIGGNGSVSTLPDDHIALAHWGDYKFDPQTMFLTRADARLLAKRINQCLDETAKR